MDRINRKLSGYGKWVGKVVVEEKQVVVMPTEEAGLGEQSVGRKEVTEFSFGHMELEILGDIHLVIPTMQQEIDQSH